MLTDRMPNLQVAWMRQDGTTALDFTADVLHRGLFPVIKKENDIIVDNILDPNSTSEESTVYRNN